uniref:Protein kinase domain-containing protein n=1 Tax=Xenopus tropicalis TaxID=8364 RepID=A0A803K3K5_XENTR
MPFCAPRRKRTAESGCLSEIYKPPDGRLTKEKLLGEGGTAAVFMGHHHRRGKVAVKMANITWDEESVCREVNFLLKFSRHRNIASYYGAYHHPAPNEESSEYLELVLEYCSGGSLYDLIKSTEGQSLKETWIGFVCREVLKALNHVHHHRAVHRDIKSPNVMLTKKGNIKLIDFGHCWDLDPQTGKCNEGDGTAHWMAPETFRRKDRKPEYDTKCDIWSLGITAIEMAEGKTPYADQKLVSDLIINNDSPRLKSRTWSQHFVSFLKSCLEKDPSQRWSAKELLQHPFIAELPPAKTIRAEIEEHLRAVQNRPAEQGLRVARWARKHLQRAREHLRGAREHIRGTMEHLWLHWAMEHLGQARKHLRGAMEHLRPHWAMEHLRPCWAMEHLRRACDFCATETSAEQKEAQQMALEGFA